MIRTRFTASALGRPRVAGLPGGVLRSRQNTELRDLHGYRSCVESLNITRPKLVRKAHQRFLDAGAQAIVTNTALAAPQLLDRYRMFDEAFAVSYLGAGLAASTLRDSEYHGSVIGDVRIPWRRRVLGFVTPWELEDTSYTLVSAQVAGGVTEIWLEAPHLGPQLQATIAGARAGMAEAGKRVPITLCLRHEFTGADLHHGQATESLTTATSLAAGLNIDRLAVIEDGTNNANLHAIAAHWSGPLAVQAQSACAAAELLSTKTIGDRLDLITLAEPRQARQLVHWLDGELATPEQPTEPGRADNDNIAASLGKSA